jgi:tetratricopeptide (TPR) repeat protein
MIIANKADHCQYDPKPLITVIVLIIYMAETFRAQNYWYERGIEYYNKMEYNTAIRCFNRSLEEGKNNGFDAWYMKGNSFYQLKEYNEAIQCFNKSVSYNPLN